MNKTHAGLKMLIVFSGLPGTGKTTLAKEVARRIDASYVRIDSIEQAILNSDLEFPPNNNTGYLVAYAVVLDNLLLGRTVIADAVNAIEAARSEWRNVAGLADSKIQEIEIVCSDLGEHRQRVEQRRADRPDQCFPTWDDVTKRHYQPWCSERIAIDTAGKSVDECVDELTKKLLA